ncbi:hypothetical protein D0469_04100 [Peribacillus saganii]|uniref:Uncharacterized protein n=1 Tax=Peribacillus saganii TaxID=2303992 RepID=A0A372LSH1_9BACI|nr:hypothetical protein [Peribacillus saganii]RFU71128.1 hypothetical protein D0469_04100 [Peribacillus saganii]
MKSLQDTLYNWLTIKVVNLARPDDTAALETTELFEQMLTDEHGVSGLVITKEPPMYFIDYKQNGEVKRVRFSEELIDIMLNQIKEEPEKYVNYK